MLFFLFIVNIHITEQLMIINRLCINIYIKPTNQHSCHPTEPILYHIPTYSMTKIPCDAMVSIKEFARKLELRQRKELVCFKVFAYYFFRNGSVLLFVILVKPSKPLKLSKG